MPIHAARDLLGVRIDLTKPQDVFLELLSWRRTGRRGYVTLVNPHTIVSCSRDPEMLAAVRDSDLALPDGVGITLASRLLGYGRASRIAGPSLMLDLCDWGRSAGLRHFFYGGGEGVADELARRLERRFPGLHIAGALCPPFRTLTPDEDESMVQTINAAAPDLVWVGLGTAKQEKWMAAHVGRIQAAALLGVGAAFNFHAGTVPWAPAWVRRAGLEWAYRLAHEPRRLWHRNLDSPIFLARVGAQMAVRASVSEQ
jgi:N-acetylglucosaminyldiphosphoundecaprenol N-acetyl-beta-D-mannosaminyltransferase